MTYFINKKIINNSFTKAANDEYFVDKSELIEKINKLIGSSSQFLCITRPRRFGKTINAMMLESYYSKNANFKHIFDNLKISKSDTYEKHLNKHNVVYLNFSNPLNKSENYNEFIDGFYNQIVNDLEELYKVNIDRNITLGKIFEDISSQTGEGFIFIIDEWDFIFNNNLFSKEERDKYLLFLKDLLKDRPYVELCYMTGVIPIAKHSTGSALNMFDECTFLNDIEYYSFYGFTTEEVENLCKKQDKLSMDELREWYDGYKIQGIDLYNPRSVVYALRKGFCQSYWTSTGPMDEIMYFINNNVTDVKKDIISMISGEPVYIQLEGYGTENLSLETRDEILSAMSVYGLLSYHDETLEIPNKELLLKFSRSLRDKNLQEISKLLSRSFDLLRATINQDTETMAEIIQYTHDIYTSIIKYNDENSLSCIITIAYISAIENYHIVREMPAGIGFADFIFFPKDISKPSFIIELKRNSTSEEALKQIFEKRYDLALKDYTGLKLAIGISYDSNLKKHSITIKTF